MQNGEKILKRHFSFIEKRIYEDHLEVTNTEDLVDYALSLTSMVNLSGVGREEIQTILDSKKRLTMYYGKGTGSGAAGLRFPRLYTS